MLRESSLADNQKEGRVQSLVKGLVEIKADVSVLTREAYTTFPLGDLRARGSRTNWRRCSENLKKAQGLTRRWFIVGNISGWEQK